MGILKALIDFLRAYAITQENHARNWIFLLSYFPKAA
jgi:hypothetical protein